MALCLLLTFISETKVNMNLKVKTQVLQKGLSFIKNIAKSSPTLNKIQNPKITDQMHTPS